MGFDEENRFKDIDNQKFDWRNIDPEILLLNDKFRDLYNRQTRRQQDLQSKTDLSDEEFWKEFDEINRLNEEDEKQSLAGFEHFEFQYFSKYERLEELRSEVDSVMYPISREFNRLPFTIHQTCSGHVDKETGLFTEDSYDSIVFVSHKLLTADEKAVQRRFIDNLATLDIRICERLGIAPYNILDIATELFDEDEVGISIFDILEQGRELAIRLNIDPEISVSPKTALTAVWSEMAKYLAEVTDKPAVIPDFKNGEVFEK